MSGQDTPKAARTSIADSLNFHDDVERVWHTHQQELLDVLREKGISVEFDFTMNFQDYVDDAKLEGFGRGLAIAYFKDDVKRVETALHELSKLGDYMERKAEQWHLKVTLTHRRDVECEISPESSPYQVIAGLRVEASQLITHFSAVFSKAHADSVRLAESRRAAQQEVATFFDGITPFIVRNGEEQPAQEHDFDTNPFINFRKVILEFRRRDKESMRGVHVVFNAPIDRITIAEAQGNTPRIIQLPNHWETADLRRILGRLQK